MGDNQAWVSRFKREVIGLSVAHSGGSSAVWFLNVVFCLTRSHFFQLAVLDLNAADVQGVTGSEFCFLSFY